MISVVNVHKAYGFENRYALRNVSFEIKDGGSFAVLGKDGAGKTTLLSVISGLLPPSSGRVIMDGEDMYRRPSKAALRVGYMSSRFFLYPEMTVREYIKYMFEIKGAKKSLYRADEAIEKCALSERAGTVIRDLDGFEKTRLSLCQAISGDVSLLVLDEPTAGLKREDAAKMRALIKQVKNGFTFVMSTRYLREATELAEDVLIMNKGRLAVATSISKLSSGAAGFAVLRLRVAAEDEKADELIAGIGAAADAEKLSGAEMGATDLLLTFPADTDIRPLIWQETVKRNIPILEMSRKDVSLEEIFLQMTGEG